MVAPRTKQDFYVRYMAGEFGNRLRSWTDPEAFAASGYDGPVGLRSLDASAPTRYFVPAAEVRQAWPEGRVVCEHAPDHRQILQGEVILRPCGLYLMYGTEPVPMKQTKVWHHVERSAAIVILRWALWPASYEDLQELLDRYPDAAIEFSAYDCAVGCLPHRNTLFWEVRRY
jgi:hypothetical protein